MVKLDVVYIYWYLINRYFSKKISGKSSNMHKLLFSRNLILLLKIRYMKFYASSNYLIFLHSSVPTLLSNWKKSKSPSPFTQQILTFELKTRTTFHSILNQIFLWFFYKFYNSCSSSLLIYFQFHSVALHKRITLISTIAK